MKTMNLKKIFSLLLCVTALISFCAVPALAAAPSDPVVTGYDLGVNIGTLAKGGTVPIIIHVKDTALNTEIVSPDGENTDNLDITRLLDSFSTGKIDEIEIDSKLGEPLSFHFTINGAYYSGSGRTLRFMLGYKNISDSFNQLDVAVRECQEYSDPVYPPDDPYVNPMPVVQIGRGDIDPIQPGQEFTLNITLTNTSKSQTLQSPVVTFSPSSAFIIADSTTSKMLNNIGRGETVTTGVKLKALSAIDSPSQSVDVRLTFNYDSGDAGIAQGSASETVLIPVETGGISEAGAPLAVITREDISKVQAGQAFTLTVNIKNVGSAAIERPVLSVSPDNFLAMMDATMSRLLDTIQPGESVQVPISLKARSEISSPSLSVDLSLKYSYGSSGQNTVSETVFIPAYVNADPKNDPVRVSGATPNVIISQYSYGDEPQVAAGSTFDLALEFLNTSSRFTVENIVMTLSTGEGLAISSSSNTMYYPSLRPGETQTEALAITVLPMAKTGSDRIEVSFSYEYLDTDQRCKVNTSQSIAIPIYQPDRFEIEMPGLPEFVSAYEEMYISLPYVNKGKSEISNVRAELVSEDGAVSAINGLQNLGNFASGSSGTIDFIFTPQMSGQVDFSFVITYEDPNAKEKTIEFPVSLYVEEPYYPSYEDYGDFPDYNDQMNEKTGLAWWMWAGIGLVGAAAVAAVIVIISRKKHPKKDALLDDFVWQGDQSSNSGGKE